MWENLSSIPGSGRSPGEGNGSPLQNSCLENPMDGGAWRATVHGVGKSRTRLSDGRFRGIVLVSAYCEVDSVKHVHVFILCDRSSLASAVLGLCCCAWALLQLWRVGLLSGAAASRCRARAVVLWLTGLAALRHAGASWTGGKPARLLHRQVDALPPGKAPCARVFGFSSRPARHRVPRTVPCALQWVSSVERVCVCPRLLTGPS